MHFNFNAINKVQRFISYYINDKNHRFKKASENLTSSIIKIY